MDKYALYLRLCTALIYLGLGIFFLISASQLPWMKPLQREVLGWAFVGFGLFRAAQFYFRIKKKKP